jgi:ADP-ribose pyrophosphatase YjhB (NUDIX family)
LSLHSQVTPLTVKGVCLDDRERVLLCQNHRGEWELPGGRPERGESFPTCLRREIEEETGLPARVLDLIAAYPYEVHPRRWVNVVVYGCELAATAAPRASAEHRKVGFFRCTDLADMALADGYRSAIQLWCRSA